MSSAHVTPPSPRLSHASALPATLGALLVVGVLLAMGLRPPAARPAMAPLDEFSAARAADILSDLLAEGVPHPTGTPANARVRDRIVAHLHAHGYDADVQRAFSCRAQGGMCAPIENIVARLPGSGGTGRAVMLTSHYDSRGAGPGASDAASSVAAILEIARILRAEAPLLNDVILLLTDGEEVGLLGAEAFVAEHPWAADVALAVNLEGRGTGGPSIMFETSEDNRWLVREFARVVRRPVASSLTYDIYRMLPNDTDATVYKRHGIAAINFAFIGNLAHYHTSRDDLERLSLRTLQHQGDNALAVVRRFAAIPLQPRSGDAAYADLFGLVVLHWPAAWTLPLVLLFGGVIALCSVVQVRRGMLKLREAGWGLLAAVLGVAGAAGLGAAAGALLATTGRAGVLHAHPEPALIGLWLGAATAVLGAGWLLAGLAGSRGLFAGVWLLLAGLTAAVAAYLPGASVVLVVPLAGGTAAALYAVTAWPQNRWSGDIAAAAAAVGAALTLVPLAILVYSAFLLEMPYAISGVVGLATLPLLPMLAVAPGVRRWHLRGVAVAASATALALTGALVVPGYSESRPRPLNIVYAADRSEGAWWVVQGLDISASSLPPALRAAAQFSDSARRGLPPVGRGPAAPAPPLDVARPSLELLDGAAPPAPAGPRPAATVPVRLIPAGAGHRVAVVLEGAGELRIHGHTVSGFRGIVPGSTTWVLHGVPADGLLLEFVLQGRGPRTIVAWDFAPGLPLEAAPLLDARPAAAAPFADGDVTVTFHYVVVAR